MSDEALMVIAEWMKAFCDTSWTVYTVFAVGAVTVFVIALVAEIREAVKR